jgi:L,D-transpeptidase ErfK/SrfK
MSMTLGAESLPQSTPFEWIADDGAERRDVMSATLRASSVAAILIALATAAPAAQRADYPIAGSVFTHAVRGGDTWTSLGARFGVDPSTLAAQNGRLPKHALRPGDLLRIDNRHLVPAGRPDGITINIPQRRLFVVRDGVLMASYPIGLGKPTWPTFTGPFAIAVKEIDPVWDVPPSIQEEMRRTGRKVLTRVGPGPSNPLGRYWLGLTVPGYGIHGTVAPSSIYRFQSHGCIRLHNEDVETLFAQVSVGTPGESIYEPVLLRVDGDAILLEAHRDIYNRARDAESRVVAHAATLGVEDRLDLYAVRQVLHRRDGQPHAVEAEER